MRAARFWIVSLAFALSACAEDGEPEPAVLHNPIAGTHWVTPGGGVDTPTIDFNESRASGETGCNRWFAQSTATSETLTFMAIGSTRRMCDPDVMEGERAFIAALRATQSARVENGYLVLRDAGGAELARFEPAE